MTLLMKLVRGFVICFAVLLAACGGDKVVVTTDDSADYRTAKQLPPLKKQVAVPPAVVRTEPRPAEPKPAEPTPAQSRTEKSNTAESKPKPSQPTPAKPAKQTPAQRVFTVGVVDVSNDIKRLKIDAVIDPAWGHLLEKLRSSGVTVHSRNKTAGRIEIGCGQIDDGSAMTERSGWKIFNKDDLIYEYCALELSEDKGSTFLSVQNRLGIEVSGNDALTVFNKILAN